MIDAYPLALQIGPIPITGFGLLMMLAFLVAYWLVEKECRRNGFAGDYAGDMLTAAMIGGVLGAKLWYLAIHPEAPFFSRAGLVWYGGFVGGTLGVILNGWRRRVPMRWTAQLIAPAMAAGYAVGRVGCYVVGDDYGRPTSLPWAVRFPEGQPISSAAVMRQEFGVAIPDGIAPETILAVHPTQLYEVAIMLGAFALLWKWRTAPRGTGWLFGAYLVFAGLERFVIEIFRAKDDRFVGVLTIAQVMSILLVLVGSALIVRWSKGGRIAAGPWLEKGSAATAPS